MRRSIWIAPLACVTALVRVAAADIDIKRADALFAEGLALRDKDVGKACEKFRESLGLNPQAIGTLLNVALCDEKQGRIASAMAKFSEARDRAKEQQLPEYIAAAQEHIDKLAPDVPYITLKFVEPPLPDTKIVVDEQVVPLDKIEKLPIDPGDRVVVVSAPGRIAFTQTVAVRVRAQETLEIPPLARSVTKVVKSSRRTLGKITVASGIGVTAIGVTLGLVARSRWNTQFEPAIAGMPESAPCMEVGDDLRCTPEGFRATNRARTYGTVGTVVGVVGLGAVAAGAFLWLTAPRDSTETQVGIVPTVGADSVGVVAAGRF